MSRSYDARRKAKRQQARIAREGAVTDGRRWHPPRAMAVIPVLAIAVILGTVGVLGFGGNSGAVDKKEIRQRVSELLAGIPQEGTTLGSPEAPVTVWMLADLECPTVRLFVESYLSSILDTWVRTGDVKLAYRSLQTDTYNEETFYKQEIAALAAGRQDKMWNFALTFVHQQGEKFTEYATDEFLADIASQVPGLSKVRWHRDREDALLSKRVARDLRTASKMEMTSTPSFLVGMSGGEGKRDVDQAESASLRREVEKSLGKHIEALSEEAFKDAPTVGPLGVGYP
jgi:protein-disulfide isomerase